MILLLIRIQELLRALYCRVKWMIINDGEIRKNIYSGLLLLRPNQNKPFIQFELRTYGRVVWRDCPTHLE